MTLEKIHQSMFHTMLRRYKRFRNLSELETLIYRRIDKGFVKYERKLPLKYFSCNKIGHFTLRKVVYTPTHPKYYNLWGII